MRPLELRMALSGEFTYDSGILFQYLQKMVYHVLPVNDILEGISLKDAFQRFKALCLIPLIRPCFITSLRFRLIAVIYHNG